MTLPNLKMPKLNDETHLEPIKQMGLTLELYILSDHFYQKKKIGLSIFVLTPPPINNWYIIRYIVKLLNFSQSAYPKT